MEIRIKVPEKYDLLASVHSWIFPDIQPVPEITFPGGFQRIFTIDDEQVFLTLYQKSPGEEIRAVWAHNGVERKAVQKKIRRVFSLDYNIGSTFDEMQSDLHLSAIGKTIEGVRPYIADSPFEALIKSIIQQQISYLAANVITKRMVLKIGNSSRGQNRAYYFPSAKEILEAGEDGLKEFGCGYKTDYVLSVCKMVANNEIDINAMQGMNYEEVYSMLTPIKGIGEWTVQALAIAGLGDYSVFPFGDLAIQKILGKLIADGRRLTKREVISFAESKGETGTMILYLLMCADALGLVGFAAQREIHKR